MGYLHNSFVRDFYAIKELDELDDSVSEQINNSEIHLSMSP